MAYFKTRRAKDVVLRDAVWKNMTLNHARVPGFLLRKDRVSPHGQRIPTALSSIETGSFTSFQNMEVRSPLSKMTLY